MKYLIFDCSAIAWRSFYSIGRLEHEGQDVGVVFGFLRQTIQFAREFQIGNILFCFDSRLSKRKKIFKDYKRKPIKDKTEEEIEAKKEAVEQMQDLRKTILPLIGFKNIYIQAGYEADDLIARLVIDNPNQCIVVTNDDDLLQLVDDCVWYSPWRKLKVNGKTFRRDYGIEPKQWAEVKKIAGCKSDCVPGVRGVAEKRAIEFIKGVSKKGVTNKIKEHKQRIERNHKLVTLPFEGTKSLEIKKDEFDIEAFEELCRFYGFKTLLDRSDEWNQMFG